MNVRDLRYFIAAAEIGHFHQAAERIGRSQAALSKCIRRLEAELGALLFEAEGRNVRLTAMGHALLPRARILVQGLQDTVREMTEMARGEAGHVRLGSGQSWAEWLLPGLFHRLLQQLPGVDIEVTTGLGGVLRQALRDGQLDLAIAPLQDGDDEEFTSFAVARDIMVVAAREGHSLNRPGLSMANLAPFGWLLPAASLASTAWLVRTLQSNGLPSPRIQVQTDTVVVLRRVVTQTDLLTFLSRRDLGHDDGVSLRELHLPGLAFHRNIGVLWLRGGYLPPAAHRVVSMLKQDGEAILGSLDDDPD